MDVYRWLGCFSLASSCLVLDAAAAEAAMSASPAVLKEMGRGVLLQHGTGLRWTRKDNGQDIDWAGAQAYCATLGMGWRLPTLAELNRLYADADRAGETVACGTAVCKAPRRFQLSRAWHWSAAAVTKEEARDFDELAWGVTMVNGKRTMGLRFAAYDARALCVSGR